MRRFFIDIAAATVLVAASLSMGASASPFVAPGATRAAADSLSIVESVQFVWLGHEYCWYDDGWRGPGWYWCGYAFNNGYGWGGGYGWHHWHGGHPHAYYQGRSGGTVTRSSHIGGAVTRSSHVSGTVTRSSGGTKAVTRSSGGGKGGGGGGGKGGGGKGGGGKGDEKK